MSESKRLPKFLTMKDFQEYIVHWSDDTVRRRIQNEGLPARRDGKGYIFDTEQVLEWFKRRQGKAG